MLSLAERQLFYISAKTDCLLPAQFQSSKVKTAGGWVGDILDRQVGTIRMALLLPLLGLLYCNPPIMCGVSGRWVTS